MSGGPPANPLAMKLFDILDDREWHRVDDVIKEVGKLVPPGKAIRRAEDRRKHASGTDKRTQPVPEERQIQYGRRSYARDAMSGSRNSLEIKFDEDRVEWVRMLSVPPRVARDRARKRAHFHLDPRLLADELRDGADAHGLLSELTQKQLFKVAVELAYRERSRKNSRALG